MATRHSRASCSKRRNIEEEPPQPQYDISRFRKIEAQERFETFGKKPIVIERSVHCDDLLEIGVRQLLHSRGWETPMKKMGGKAHRAIVREFYCNARIRRDGRSMIKSWVRSRKFVCDENLIARVLGVRREQHPVYPLANAEDLTLCCRELTGNPNFLWMPRQKNIPQGILTDKYKLLNLIAVSNITPQCRHNQIFEKRIRLLHAIGTRVPMDLCSIILGEIIAAVEDKTTRGALPFGRLITEMCRLHEVELGPTDDIVKGMAPIDGGTLKRSRSARPPREGDQQEEEEDEEGEELMAIEGRGTARTDPGAGPSQREEPPLTTLLEQLLVDQRTNHQMVMRRLDQQDAKMDEWMRRYQPQPPE